ncbi:MAG: DNA-directed RNA polymerase subunit omega [Rickettsiaceae bacterium]|nr:DNA-directed RNA polymerase subunit omega [Rickettsiaceae bacterium]
MARVTVEDCVGEGKTNNRFELVILAAQRAKDIHAGAHITVPVDNDKKTVISLKEIAAGHIKIQDLKERFLHTLHPQSINEAIKEEIEFIDKEIHEEFTPDNSDYALTEDQMHVDDDSMYFEDEEGIDDEKI